MHIKRLIVFIAIIVGWISCKPIGIYEKMAIIPQHEWSSQFKPDFTFSIKDTSVRYNIFVVVRHTDSYHYNNIWLNFSSIAPADTVVTQKINLKLGDNKQWLGSSMDDVIEHRILVNKDPVSLKQGNYIFILQNAMREDPLENILNVGIRIERAE